MAWHNDKYDAWLDAIKPAGYEPKCSPVTAEIVKAQNEVYRKLMEPDFKRTFTPQRILRHGIATIVFWRDGTKTVVKRREGEQDNEYAAFTAALAAKVFGSNSQVKSVLRHKTETAGQKKKAETPVNCENCEHPAKKREIQKGDRVKYAEHSSLDIGLGECYYPPLGTVGEALQICGDGDVLVHWPDGTTMGDGEWFCAGNCLEAVE